MRVWIGSGVLENKPFVIEGHQGNVNGVAFGRRLNTVVSAGYDGSIRITPLTGAAPTVVTVADADQCAQHRLRRRDHRGRRRRKGLYPQGGRFRAPDDPVQEMPVTSLAVSADGEMIAAAGLRGSVTIISRETGRTLTTLVGPGLPVWSLAFHPEGKILVTGGADRCSGNGTLRPASRWRRRTRRRRISGEPDE